MAVLNPRDRELSIAGASAGDTHTLARPAKQIDEEAMPADLESSNPDNDKRYERLGFRRVGEFSAPDGSRTVASVWREPR